MKEHTKIQKKYIVWKTTLSNIKPVSGKLDIAVFCNGTGLLRMAYKSSFCEASSKTFFETCRNFIERIINCTMCKICLYHEKIKNYSKCIYGISV
jgi:hypothetical protein